MSQELSNGVLSPICDFNTCILEEFGDKCGLFPNKCEGGPFVLFLFPGVLLCVLFRVEGGKCFV